MSNLSAAAFVAIVSGRHGHFRLESGHHSRLWLNLDALFADQSRVTPFVDALATALRPYGADTVCGPLVGGAFLAQLVAQVLGAEFCFAERVVASDGDALFGARYRVPSAYHSRIRGRRVALVDDIMSAGSSLRGTYAELQTIGAIPVAVGALLVLGAIGEEFFRAEGVPVLAVARDRFEMWKPSDCPLCAVGDTPEEISAGAV